MTITLLQGDCREVLSTLDAGSVQCCITSPPFYGLRRYDVEGAQIGNEPTPAAYVAALLDVFREVKRVLRDDGTMWINLGDSYTGSGKGGNPADSPWAGFPTNPAREGQAKTGKMDVPGLAEKNLIGIPWSVAFALRDDGWYLRSAITWCKGNPMPESVRDRCTSATEMIFLLAKQPRYFYDADAIREPHSDNAHHGLSMNRASAFKKQSKVGGHGNGAATIELNPAGRNRRNWWVVNSQPFAGSHFAVFPEKLVEPMVLAGSSPRACERCNAPWERVTEKGMPSEDSERPQARRAAQLFRERGLTQAHLDAIRSVGAADAGQSQLLMTGYGKNRPDVQRLADEAKAALAGYYREFLTTFSSTTGWCPTCACPNTTGAARCVVLDPFCGSGTTMRVSERYGRDSIGIDLGYLDLASKRTDGVQIDMESLL